MATFPSSVPAPSYGISKSSKPKIRVVKFMDGSAEQRLSFGMNNNPKTWNPTWENITEAQSDTIETFLDARAADADYFTWTPPNESSSGKYVCLDWTKQINVSGFATITATFEQVFEA
tara:strand:- start:35 stop:388 length:354 start_codon:yes stop_codon:yes gene_type:complete